MHNSIIVSVSELRSLIQDVRRSGCDYVQVTISDPLDDDGEIIPPSLDLSACKKDSTNIWVDFDSLFSVEDEKEFKSNHSHVEHKPNLL